jgi:LacI family transcriptional regulator
VTRPHKPVRLADVARRARVSSATVSRVLNDPLLVSETARSRVFRAIEALKWIPNGAAKALASARSRTVGILIPTLGHQNFGVLIDALQRELSRAQLTLLLACDETSPDRRVQQARKMVERGIECLILIGESHPPALFELLDAYRVPRVITYTSGREKRNPCIGFDNQAAAAEVTRHLLSLGHRSFGLIAHMVEGNDRIQQRMAGIHETLRREGISIHPAHYAQVDSRYVASGREGLRRILAAREDRPTALICTNDYIATGAIIEARHLRIDVPGQLSIAGFDDTDMSAHLNPPLTTIRVPSREMGEAVARYIIDYLANGKAEVPGPIPAPLNIRESTSAPSQSSARTPNASRPR